MQSLLRRMATAGILAATLLLLTTAGAFPLLTAETSLALSGRVALSGDTALVENNIFVRTPLGWQFQQQLQPPGWDYAPLALNGNTAVIATNVYERTGAGWSLVDALPGYPDSVAIDGDLLVVGDTQGYISNFLWGGVAQVYVRTNSHWVREATLTAEDPSSDVVFGYSVAVSGGTIVVTSDAWYRQPAMYVFTRTPTGWKQEAKLRDSDSLDFAQEVAVRGNLLAVTSWATNGKVSLYERIGERWTLRQRLDWPAEMGPAIGVALGEDALAASDTKGNVHVFVHYGGEWAEQQTLASAAGSPNSAQIAISSNGVIVSTYTGGTIIYEPQDWTWQSVDVGDVGAPGHLSQDAGALTISGAGVISDTSDSFHYACREWSGDLEMRVRVSGATATKVWAEGGVMFRGSLAPDAAHAFVNLRTAPSLGFRARTNAGGESLYAPGPWVGTPYWLKLVKLGATVTAYYSLDATSWYPFTDAQVDLPQKFYVGLAVTSHDRGSGASFNFEHVAFTRILLPARATGLTAVATNVDRVVLSWNDNATNEFGYLIKRNGFAAVTLPPDTMNFVDSGVYPGATFSYTVQAVTPEGYGPESEPAVATTFQLPPPWLSQDIGAGSQPGSAAITPRAPYSPGFEITAPGRGFHFMYRAQTGDFDIRAYPWIETIRGNAPGIRAGLMIRASLEPNSPYVMLAVTEQEGDRLITRSAAGATSEIGWNGSWSGEFRIVRRGNVISAFHAEAGGLVLMAEFTTDLPDTVYLGFAATGTDDGQPVVADFSSLYFAEGSNVHRIAPPVLSAVAVSPTQINLYWTDENSNRLAFLAEEWRSHGQYVDLYLVGWLASNETSIADRDLTPHAAKTYRVQVELPDGDWLWSNLASATTPWPESNLPPPWRSANIGSATAHGAGTLNETNGVWTVWTDAGEIGGKADSFQYAFQPLIGDGYIIAHTGAQLSESNHVSWPARFGLMIRQSLEPGSAAAFAFRDSSLKLGFLERTNTGALAVAGVPLSTWNTWLKLARVGDQFTAYMSDDGQTWAPLGGAEIPMTDSVLIGLAVNSSGGIMVGGGFDAVQIGPPKPAAISPPVLVDGTIQLKLNAVPGRTNRVEISPDLIHWTQWTNRYSVSGELFLDDHLEPGIPARFYRAIPIQ